MAVADVANVPASLSVATEGGAGDGSPGIMQISSIIIIHPMAKRIPHKPLQSLQCSFLLSAELFDTIFSFAPFGLTLCGQPFILNSIIIDMNHTNTTILINQLLYLLK